MRQQTENLSRIQPFQPEWPSYQLVAPNPAIGILKTEQNVDGVAQTLLWNELRRVPTMVRFD